MKKIRLLQLDQTYDNNLIELQTVTIEVRYGNIVKIRKGYFTRLVAKTVTFHPGSPLFDSFAIAKASDQPV